MHCHRTMSKLNAVPASVPETNAITEQSMARLCCSAGAGQKKKQSSEVVLRHGVGLIHRGTGVANDLVLVERVEHTEQHWERAEQSSA